MNIRLSELVPQASSVESEHGCLTLKAHGFINGGHGLVEGKLRNKKEVGLQ